MIISFFSAALEQMYATEHLLDADVQEVWNDVGKWSMTLPRDEFLYIKDARYAYIDGYFGLIDEIKRTSELLKLSGRGILAVLDDYVADAEVSIKGNAETTIYALIADYAPEFETEAVQGLPNLLNTSHEAGSLLDVLTEVLDGTGLAPKVTIDTVNNRLKFGIVRGAVRTIYNTGEDAFVLSDSLGNIENASYTINTKDEKNYVVLKYGEDDDENPLIREYDMRGEV